MSKTGEYLRATRVLHGMNSLRELSEKTAQLGEKISLESIRRYELGLKYPSERVVNILAKALSLDEIQKTYFLTLLAMDKLKDKFPTAPVLILNEEYMSMLSEAVGSMARRVLEGSGIDIALSVTIQLELVAECRTLLQTLTATVAPSTWIPDYGSLTYG